MEEVKISNLAPGSYITGSQEMALHRALLLILPGGTAVCVCVCVWNVCVECVCGAGVLTHLPAAHCLGS